jgi:hypothetical protein
MTLWRKPQRKSASWGQGRSASSWAQEPGLARVIRGDDSNLLLVPRRMSASHKGPTQPWWRHSSRSGLLVYFDAARLAAGYTSGETAARRRASA